MKTQIKKNFLTCLGVFMLFSCKKEEKNLPIHPENITKNKIELPVVEAKDSLAVKEEAPAPPFIFPKNISLLFPAYYRLEPYSYPKNIKQKKWIELSGNVHSKNWKLQEANVGVRNPGDDECAGTKQIEVFSKNKEAVLFFTDFPGLNKEAQTLAHSKTLLPGEHYDLVMNNKTFRIMVKGKAFVSEENEYKEIKKYTFDTEGNPWVDQIRNFELIVQMPNKGDFSPLKIKAINGQIPKLIWAGDLNQDEIPDFFIDGSNDYENNNFYFFLSDPSDMKNPIKKVAYLERIFDC